MTIAGAGAGAAPLLSTVAVRERSRNIARAVEAGASGHFRIDRSRLDDAARWVARVTRERYPDLDIPYHSRWRHFEAGGVDRIALIPKDPHAQVDLAVVSVLLDAGAGPDWKYHEHATGKTFARSEGLGVATLRAFVDGVFSASADPFRVDAERLVEMDAEALGGVFQASAVNPLVGLEGRAALMRRLGAALGGRRPGALYDALTATTRSVSVHAMVRALLDMLGPVWLTGASLDGVPLGDAWRHPHAGGEGQSAGWVPFHKLTQWLAYSLLEPFEWSGVALTDRDALTALPEYRNGGLLLDTGVIAWRDPREAALAWDVGSDLVVEWRALTVTLVDELVPPVRAALGKPELPLACILEGGTWAAGRALAREARNGNPPFAVRSDGTVF